MSPFRLKAMRWLRGHPGERATEFALAMWPDSSKWQSSYNTGHGSVSGMGIVKSGGSYLGKLRKAGLAFVRYRDRFVPEWHLTPEGELVLQNAETRAALKRMAGRG